METTTQAAPSPAPAAEPKLDAVIPKSGSTEYAEWRMTGKLPEPEAPKPPETQADSSPDDQPKVASSEDEAEPEPAEAQEPKKSKTAKRWKKLTDELADLRRQLANTQRPAPVQQEQRLVSEPTPMDTNSDGTPKYASYEDYVKDAIQWGVQQGIREQMRQIQENQSRAQLAESVKQARERYEDFDTVGLPVADRLLGDTQISPALKARINNSKVLPDLLYTIGGNAEFQERFLTTMRTDPEAARDAIAVMERDIQERVAKPQKMEVPVRRGPEKAPEPPLDTGNRGVVADSNTRLLEAVARGDRNATRQWMEAENRKALMRRRGA